MLIPFYIFLHENSFPEYNSNGQKPEELKAEYQVILERLDELEQQGIKQGKTQGISETKKQTALRMLEMGRLTIEEIAECSELSVAEVEQLAGLQTV